MDIVKFYDCVEQHPDLEGVGVDTCEAGRPGVVVRHKPTRLMTRLPAAAIEALEDWKAIEEVLVGKREPVVLQQMTRVVGYFSRVENWNKSKLGELSDRRRGNYGVADEAGN